MKKKSKQKSDRIENVLQLVLFSNIIIFLIIHNKPELDWLNTVNAIIAVIVFFALMISMTGSKMRQGGPRG